MNKFDNRNLGIGEYDEEERALLHRRTTTGSSARSTWARSAAAPSSAAGCSSAGPIRNRTSAVEAPTIRVNDAFTSGGAQVRGGQHSQTGTVGADLDYVRGIHTLPHRRRSST